MSENDENKSTDTVEQQPLRMSGFMGNADKKAVPLSDVLDEIAPTGVTIEAKDLVGKTFEIVRARPFESRFPGQDYAYFLVGYIPAEDLLFNTVIGGGACIEILDLWARQGRDEPLAVTLQWIEGGKYRGYYTFE